jgi:hypothetical protein
MVTFLITSLFLLATFAVVIYLRRKPGSGESFHVQLPAVPPRVTSLFEDRTAQLVRVSKPGHSSEELKARAEAGDRSVLADARRVNADAVYAETLRILTERCSTDDEFLRLVSFVARDENLMVTPDLATGLIERWKQQSDRIHVSEMLHVTALSNDAALYRSACRAAVDFYLSGKLPRIKATALSSLIEGEYWILSSDARASGAGFVLKQSIAEFRKQLVSRINQ